MEQPVEQQIQRLNNKIGQIAASIEEVEDLLSVPNYEDYCNHAYSCIAHIKVIIKELKEDRNEESDN